MAPHNFEISNNNKITNGDEELNLEKLNNIEEDEFLNSTENNSYFETEIIWSNVFGFVSVHFVTFITILTFPYKDKLPTLLFSFLYLIPSILGVTVFGHRYLSHRAFKANKSLKILMMCFYSMGGNYSAFTWLIDHRIHHKFCDTSADPYNAKRGLFYSHIGWLVMKKTPEYYKRKPTIDINDFTSDKLLVLFEKNYRIFYLFFTILIPTLIPCYFWNETFYYSCTINITRYIISLHFIWTINSLAHFYGVQPYDKKSTPRENKLVTILTLGEGWHNYHHTFPWDYKASENGKFNLSANFIELFAKIGWAYDLKEASPKIVEKMINKYTISSM